MLGLRPSRPFDNNSARLHDQFISILFFLSECLMKLIAIAWALLVLCSCAGVDSQQQGFTRDIPEFEYPFAVKEYSFNSQGERVQMSYMDVAPTHSPKDVIVLLHGKNFSGFYFKTLINYFRDQGLRVIVPDQIGFGKSSKPQNYQYSFHALGENTLGLLKSLNVDKFLLLGHSMGGMLATRISLMAPERVSKLMLVNPIGLEDWKTMLPYRAIGEWYERDLAASVDKMRAYQQKSYYDGVWKPEYEEILAVNKGLLQGPDWHCLSYGKRQRSGKTPEFRARPT